MSFLKQQHLVLSVVVVIVIILFMVISSQRSAQKVQKSISSHPTAMVTKQVTSYPSPTATESSTIIPLSSMWQAGTKEYIDPKIDITFQYPKDLLVEVYDTQKEDEAYKKQYPDSTLRWGIAYVVFQTPRVVRNVENQPGFDYRLMDDNTVRIIMNARENKNDLSFNEYLRMDNDMPGIDGKTPVYVTLEKGLTPITIQGRQSYQYVGTGGGENYRKAIYIPYKKKVYEFTLFGGNNTGQRYSKDAEELFDKMIESIILK